MKKGIIMLSVTAAVLISSAATYAGNKDVDDAWCGCCDVAPNYQSPQWLASTAQHNHVAELNSTQRDKLDTDEGWTSTYCYIYNEPHDHEYNYIMLKFNNFGEFTSITARYRAKVDGETTVKLYAWDGENWDKLAENDGGQNPPTETANVTNYMDAQQLLILLQTRSEDAGDDTFSVTLGDLNYQ